MQQCNGIHRPKSLTPDFVPSLQTQLEGYEPSCLILVGTTCQLLNSFHASFPASSVVAWFWKFSYEWRQCPRLKRLLLMPTGRQRRLSLSLQWNASERCNLIHFHGCCFQHHTTIPDAGKATWKGGVCISQTHFIAERDDAGGQRAWIRDASKPRHCLHSCVNLRWVH